MKKTITKIVKYLVLLGLLFTICVASFYFYRLSLRPEEVAIKKQLWQGVVYHRLIKTQPNRMIIHLVEIDLSVKGIQFLVSAPQNPESLDINAQTTSQFLEKNKLQLAINGSFFTPFHTNGPFDYYPHEGDPVDVLGLAISSGKTYSSDFLDWAVFCVSKDFVEISKKGCKKDTQQAIAGKELIVKQGQLNTSLLKSYYATSPQPRSAIAINKDQTKVWFVVVDGRQKGYSDGISLGELAGLLKDFGAYNAINLDGGGSSTLVAQQAGKAQLLNAPYNSRIPMRERVVANHLGIYALPLKLQK